MIPQYKLARRFKEGEDPDSIPKASNVEVESAEGSDDEFEAYIVGYNWAMYAGRKSDGEIVVFTGWYGYSQTTSKQMSEIKHGIGYSNFRESDLAPKVRSEGYAKTNTGTRRRASPHLPA